MNQQPYAGYRSGFVAILGRPNVGKSTLMNALLDFKLAIVHAKAQTTRDRIHGIYSDERRQLVLIDTPGVMEPRDTLNECLRDAALEALEGADAALHLVDAADPRPLPEAAARALQNLGKPVVLAPSRCDLLPGFDPAAAPAELRPRFEPLAQAPFYRAIQPVAGALPWGLGELVETLGALMPEGPPLYDPEQLTDRDLRFLSAEIVREQVLELCEQEVPYSVAVRCEEFKERPGAKHLVRVVIYVEHESQKGILIGKGGEMLRRIGAAARPGIEELADHPVFLELWVKLRKNWRKHERDLREFGYRRAARGKKKARRRG